MNSIKDETREFLELLPTTNSVNAYGSGYFKQNTGADQKKALDLIISVDNPSEWHKENYEANPWMYKGSGKRALFHYAKDVNFPKSLGTFFTDFESNEYKMVVVDKRLLYENLETWNHFSLSGRFQKPMALLIDNSNGVLPELMRKNYENAIKTSLLLCPRIPFNVRELYETIASLSYMGDMRVIFHCEDPNKIRNIVDGSYEFFEETYGSSDFFWRSGDYICRNNNSNLEMVETLPESLKNYIHEDLSYKDIRHDKMVSKRTIKYFRNLDFSDSLKMALRCWETVGMDKTLFTIKDKANKGLQKVKK